MNSEALSVTRAALIPLILLLAAVSSRAQEPPRPLSSAEECALKPGDTFKECDTCPELVVVPSGSFVMGSPNGEPGRYDDESPQHQVTISRPIAVGKFTVRVDEFSSFAKATRYDAGGEC